MNLTKGKLTKIMNKRKQSMRRYKKQRKYRRASKTFRRRKPLNLHRSSMKKMYNHDNMAWIGGKKDANGVDWTKGVDSRGRPQWRQSGTSVRTYVDPFTSSESPDEKVPGIVKSAEDAPLAADADAADVADAADAADPLADPAVDSDPVKVFPPSTTEVPVAYTKTFDTDPTEVLPVPSAPLAPLTTTTEVPADSTEVPADSTEVPADSTEVPLTTATEVPADSTEVPADSTEVPLTTATEVPLTTATEVPLTTATEVSAVAEAESSTKPTMEEAFKVITDGIADAVVLKLQKNDSDGLQNNPIALQNSMKQMDTIKSGLAGGRRSRRKRR